MNLPVHHIGYLVKKGSHAREAFLSIGYSILQDWVRDEGRGIDISFLRNGSLTVELVCPYREDSTVSGLLKRLKNCPYHICYISESLENDSEILRNNGFLPITDPSPAPACGGHPVQFFMHPDMGMIELVEKAFPWQNTQNNKNDTMEVI